jgi:hypothetical protein
VFTDTVTNQQGVQEQQPANLPANMTYEMHIRYAAEAAPPLIIVPNSAFARGESVLNSGVHDELSIEHDAVHFEVIPTSIDLVRDIFGYLPGDKRIVLKKAEPLPVIYNVTQKEFEQ